MSDPTQIEVTKEMLEASSKEWAIGMEEEFWFGWFDKHFPSMYRAAAAIDPSRLQELPEERELTEWVRDTEITRRGKYNAEAFPQFMARALRAKFGTLKQAVDRKGLVKTLEDRWILGPSRMSDLADAVIAFLGAEPVDVEMIRAEARVAGQLEGLEQAERQRPAANPLDKLERDLVENVLLRHQGYKSSGMAYNLVRPDYVPVWDACEALLAARASKSEIETARDNLVAAWQDLYQTHKYIGLAVSPVASGRLLEAWADARAKVKELEKAQQSNAD